MEAYRRQKPVGSAAPYTDSVDTNVGCFASFVVWYDEKLHHRDHSQDYPYHCQERTKGYQLKRHTYSEERTGVGRERQGKVQNGKNQVDTASHR